MKVSKAQAAMEFLMTYGWAILVTLVALGSLIYFNAFNPKGVLPDQCVMFAGFGCSHPYAAPVGASVFFKFTFQNALGYTMENYQVTTTVAGVPPTSVFGIPYAPFSMEKCDPPVSPNLQQDAAVTCGYRILNPSTYGIVSGSVIKGEIAVAWTDLADQQRKRSGTFSITIQ